MNTQTLIAAAMASSLLLGCGGSGGSSSNTQGQLTVSVTDGPVEQASAVVVAFTAIEVKPIDGQAFTIDFDETQAVNLLDYQGENFISLLDEHALNAGDYNWLRLAIDESDTYIVVNGNQHTLRIPSGSQSGLKLNHPFTVGAGDNTHIALDFELRKSIHLTGSGKYQMKPVIRVVDSINAYTVSGVLADSLVLDVNCDNDPNNAVGNAVYLFAGHDSLLQDMQGNDDDVLSSSAVNYNAENDRYEFTLGFVPQGDYSLSFTCDAVNDQPFDDDSADIEFSDPLNITVADDNLSDVLLD
ncbi:DUF4382 domain-containing protein [Dasania sp. GY-MA-18]|uniref:DUF4382 domain-containing protein n=1 Tax=Dasania phycosphaerae TaxID=2950436 RepID=A0A9J6RJ54_9GAMM|nr:MULTISPECIES: DUF4382 domain-containing protein [Dasania]MCR8921990.1 DUF4382 domain-containing protein [Dasania sp. GY-MA-18]MCZ0864418.1 DUF4382 domain-containing protein [Dasania phycosphaerae]MCZ0868146.1 DUF4382 domain-containing protein [Dasania phycosphaerae]